MKSKRRLTIFLAAGVCAVAILAFRAPIQRAATRWRVLRTDAPSLEAMQAMVEESSDPAKPLRALWNTEKIPHRTFVLDSLRGRRRDPALNFSAVRDILMTAAHSGDVDGQQSALAILAMRDDPEVEPLALSMLHDIDPEVRQVALRSLADANDPRYAPIFLAMRNDPDRITRQYAIGGLSRLTEEEVTPSIHHDDDDGPTFDAWQNWWNAHSADHPNPATMPSAKTWSTVPTGIATDFTLNDLDGKPMSFSELHGKVVLLNFWATWCAPCVSELPTLSEFATRRKADVAVLGICVDATPEEPMQGEAQETFDEALPRIKKFMETHAVSYKILIDRDGDVTNAYGGTGLPTNILIAPDGTIRRRFIGERSADVLSAMVDEIESH